MYHATYPLTNKIATIPLSLHVHFPTALGKKGYSLSVHCAYRAELCGLAGLAFFFNTLLLPPAISCRHLSAGSGGSGGN